MWKILFPSWRFFDRPSEETPFLELQTGTHPNDLGQWMRPSAPRRSGLHLFLNSEENLLLFLQTCLETTLLKDVQRGSQGEASLNAIAHTLCALSEPGASFFRYRIVLSKTLKESSETLYESETLARETSP